MGYDTGKDYEEFMGGAPEFAHAQIAKRLIDAKRKAKAMKGMGGDPMGGDSHMGGAPDADPMDEEMHETVTDELSESPAEQAHERAAGTEMHEKITMELTPEEAAKIQAMRSGHMA